MGVHRERSVEAVGFFELLAAPAAKRRWTDDAKGRMVAETLVPGSAEAFVLGEPLLRHWSERQWRKTGLVMAYKRLEEHTSNWPAVKDGLMMLNHAQFEALFAGLDWRRVRAVEAKVPETVE